MKTVLVVDDDSQIRKLLRRTLENRGYQVSEAANGLEAERMYKSNRPDLMITDIVMPEKEGIETILDLIRYDPTATVIAISGGGRIPSDKYLKLAKQLGAARVFEKPLNLAELVDGVDALIGS